MSQDNFDEEILRYFEPLNRQLKELQNKVATLEVELAAHEKRELLRVRGNQFCRVCNQGHMPTPPISDAERLYCEANHAIGAEPVSALRLPAFRPATSWDDVGKHAAAVRKARGGG